MTDKDEADNVTRLTHHEQKRTQYDRCLLHILLQSRTGLATLKSFEKLCSCQSGPRVTFYMASIMKPQNAGKIARVRRLRRREKQEGWGKCVAHEHGRRECILIQQNKSTRGMEFSNVHDGGGSMG